jgi:hypothetical protein
VAESRRRRPCHAHMHKPFAPPKLRGGEKALHLWVSWVELGFLASIQLVQLPVHGIHRLFGVFLQHTLQLLLGLRIAALEGGRGGAKAGLALLLDVGLEQPTLAFAALIAGASWAKLIAHGHLGLLIVGSVAAAMVTSLLVEVYHCGPAARRNLLSDLQAVPAQSYRVRTLRRRPANHP